MSGLRYLLWGLALCGVCVSASEQTSDVDQAEAGLKQCTADLQQISDQLDAGDVSDKKLAADLQTLLDLQAEFQEIDQALKTALVKPSQRLSDLGPPPAEGQPVESDDITELRETLGDEVTHLTGLTKEAELSAATVDRLIGRVRTLQGGRFFSRISQRNLSPFSAQRWSKAFSEIPPALEQLTDHVAAWREQERTSGKPVSNLALLAAALVGAIALLMAPLAPGWRRIGARLGEKPSPSKLDRRRRVAARAASRGLLVAAAGALLYFAAVETQLVTGAGQGFALRLWLGPAAFVLVWNYSQGVFSPGHAEWRIARIDSRAASRLRTLLIAVFGVFILDRCLYTGFNLAGVGIELTLAQAMLSSGVFAVLVWFLLSPKLWHSGDPTPGPADDGQPDTSTAPQNPHPGSTAESPGTHWGYRVLRVGGRLLAVLVVLAIALSYIRWADFVFHRMVLLALLVLLLWLLRVLGRWGLSQLPALQATAGGAPRDADADEGEALGFWLWLALDLALLALAVPGFLLVVGFDWLDVRRWVGLLNSDIRFGALSVSFTDIFTAVVAFLLVSMGTRWISHVVDKNVLQRAHLDAGERNSIMTLVNYVGMAVATLIALAIVGLGLSKLALVAGALSVGIGFGLQSIVNNFVSGLILLFERPIKLGDWVVVQSGEGYVKHIGARATEIQTFDRASVIIPNSELVTSAVQNWFYKSRLGRLRVDVGVSYGSDPEQVREILLGCAKQHKSISSYPAASVRWTDFGDSALQFQLRAYIRNVDDSYEVRSDLRFAIFKAFKAAGVEIPFPQRDVHVRSDGKLVAGSTTEGADAEPGDGGKSGDNDEAV